MDYELIGEEFNIDEARVIGKALDIAWEGVQVTLLFPNEEKRVYTRIWEETESGGRRPVVEEAIYSDFENSVNIHTVIPPHVSINF